MTMLNAPTASRLWTTPTAAKLAMPGIRNWTGVTTAIGTMHLPIMRSELDGSAR